MHSRLCAVARMARLKPSQPEAGEGALGVGGAVGAFRQHRPPSRVVLPLPSRGPLAASFVVGGGARASTEMPRLMEGGQIRFELDRNRGRTAAAGQAC